MPRDAWSLKSLLPPRLLNVLRRLRELAHKVRRLHLNRPKAPAIRGQHAALNDVAAAIAITIVVVAIATVAVATIRVTVIVVVVAAVRSIQAIA